MRPDITKRTSLIFPSGPRHHPRRRHRLLAMLLVIEATSMPMDRTPAALSSRSLRSSSPSLSPSQDSSSKLRTPREGWRRGPRSAAGARCCSCRSWGGCLWRPGTACGKLESSAMGQASWMSSIRKLLTVRADRIVMTTQSAISICTLIRTPNRLLLCPIIALRSRRAPHGHHMRTLLKLQMWSSTKRVRPRAP